MKRKLFLIGNGFDLAHGIPTSYNDLMNWYIENLMKELQGVKYIDDDFFDIDPKYQIEGGGYAAHSIPDSFSELLNSDFVKAKNEIFRELVSSYHYGNWVDNNSNNDFMTSRET